MKNDWVLITLVAMGRLGNQMFQYVSTQKVLQSHRGYEYTIPPENPEIQIDNYGLIEAFELSDNKKIGWLNTQYDIIAGETFSYLMKTYLMLFLMDLDSMDSFNQKKIF